MILDGVREVPLSRIRWPGARLKELLEDPFVAELAEAIDSEGLIHFPVLHKRTLAPIAGEHRLAAHVLKKAKTVTVRLFDGTDIEAEKLRVGENLHRKHRDQAKLRVAYMEARAAELLQSDGGDEEEDISGHDVQELPKPGRKPDPVAKARKEVAEELGVSERTLRRDEAKVKAPESAPAVSHDLGIETWGQEHERSRLESFAAVGHALEAAALKVDQARGALSRLTNGTLPMDKDICDEVSDELGKQAKELRAWKPVAVCPTCHDQDAKRTTCPECLGSGWLTQPMLDARSRGASKKGKR